MIMMHIYYENFNLNNNHILTKCINHLKLEENTISSSFWWRFCLCWRRDQSSKHRDRFLLKKIEFKEIMTWWIDPLIVGDWSPVTATRGIDPLSTKSFFSHFLCANTPIDFRFHPESTFFWLQMIPKPSSHFSLRFSHSKPFLK